MKKGWEIKRLGDVCDIKTGKKDVNQGNPDGKYPFFTCAREHTYSDSYSFDTEALLIAGNGDVGNVSYFKGKFEAYQRTYVLYNFKGILPRLLFLILDGYLKDKMSNQKLGNTMPYIKLGMLTDFEIPFPPLSEQKEIVAILDKAFIDITKAKENAEQNLKNAKELFESYLQSIFNNKSTDWVISTIGETCNLQTGGTPSTSKVEYYKDGKIKWLVSGDINQKIINDCEGRITELGLADSNARYLPVNSVLIALNGQGKTRGTVAMLRTKATCNQSLVSIYPKNEKALLPELIFSNLEGRYEEIRRMTGDGGNDRRGLNMPLIRSIKFSYPKDINEQKKIIEKLDKLRASVNKLENIYKDKIKDLEELKKSILQKAFNGELKSAKV